MALKSAKWVKLFDAFVSDIRITSKEAVSQDERGTPLEMWEFATPFHQGSRHGLGQRHPQILLPEVASAWRDHGVVGD
jgi:hypothetical protein